jgi:uncharacterized protein (DUF1697 family)
LVQDGRVADYVAFLRAINLGKNRKFPMTELRSCLAAAGFDEVETYIQTGNVRLRSTMRSPVRLAERLEELFEADRGFAVPTVVLTAPELRTVYDDACALDAPIDGAGDGADGLRRYVTLLKEPPAPAAVQEIETLDHDGEAARVRGRAVHVWVRDGYQNARINNARIEKLCGAATTRDLKVITTLAQRWGA